MYGKIATTAGSVAGGGALAYTGFNSMSMVVFGGTLMALGAAAVRMARRPRGTAYDAAN